MKSRPDATTRWLMGIGGAKVGLALLFIAFATPWGQLMAAAPGQGAVAGSRIMKSVRRQDIVKALPADEVTRILITRLRRLKEREAELDQREKNLNLLKAEIEERIKELKKLQNALEGEVSKAQSREQARFQHLVGVYSAMQPQRAAALLDKMDDKTVVKIFALMKSRKVAAIMGLMDPDKAARISDALTKRQPQ